jgi:hypothetical protein
MIADDRDSPLERAVKLITAPIWVPFYLVYVTCRSVAEALARRKASAVEVDATSLQPWMPTREFERAVFAALILAGEPVNNRRLAELMDCSPGEASRRVAQLEGVIRKARKGREVLISLH